MTPQILVHPSSPWERREDAETDLWITRNLVGHDAAATYSGDAMGHSLRTVGEDDDATTSSGEFTANVMLSATFGAAASDSNLNVSITGFARAAHVNPAWHVLLGEVSLDAALSVNTVTGTVTDGSAHGVQFATDGDWVAHLCGATGAPQFRMSMKRRAVMA